MRTPQSPRFALALCLTAALAACGSSESDVPADASAVDASSADDGSTSDADAATPDAPEDAGDGSDVFDTNLCYLGAESEPPVLWIGADNVGPCDQPCYEVVTGYQWDEARQCWGDSQPMMCWRTYTAGAEPTCNAVPGVGVIWFGYAYFNIMGDFPTVTCPSPDPYLAPCD